VRARGEYRGQTTVSAQVRGDIGDLLSCNDACRREALHIGVAGSLRAISCSPSPPPPPTTPAAVPSRPAPRITLDANGDPTGVTDPNGNSTALAYDAANRLTALRYPDPTQDVAFGYGACPNGAGRLCIRTDPSGEYILRYDGFGQLTETTRTTAGVSFTTAYACDARDRVTATVNGTRVPLVTTIGYRADGTIETRAICDDLKLYK